MDPYSRSQNVRKLNHPVCAFGGFNSPQVFSARNLAVMGSNVIIYKVFEHKEANVVLLKVVSQYTHRAICMRFLVA